LSKITEQRLHVILRRHNCKRPKLKETKMNQILIFLMDNIFHCTFALTLKFITQNY